MATAKNAKTAKTVKPAAKAAAKPAAKAAKCACAKSAAKPAAKPAAKAAKPAVKVAAKAAAQAVEYSCYSPDSGIDEVAGDFNGWVPSKNPMKKDASGNWSVKIKLAPGRYAYKFVYDGAAWELDRNAPAMVDVSGNLNSVIDVD